MGDGSRVSQSIMKCLCSGEQAREEAVGNVAAGDLSAQPGGPEIFEEAESSIREGGCLNYEEARALLGRMEYNQGNFEGALHVFQGIDIPALIPKMILAISSNLSHQKHRARGGSSIVSMSMHAVGLLFEAIFLKAKSLKYLGRFKEAAQLCSTLLDTIESALPQGMPNNFGIHCRLQETLTKAVELLPELWKLEGSGRETIASYRRALLSTWNLSPQTMARIQKQFAIFLLHGDCENNFEEAIRLLMILLRNFGIKKVKWDPTVLDHLMFALCVCGELKSLSQQIEGLLPGILNRNDRYYLLALCYYGEGEYSTALNLLKKILSPRENPNCFKSLILASQICSENPSLAEEGVIFAKRLISKLDNELGSVAGIANSLLSISLSTHARSSVSDSQGLMWQSESLVALQTAHKILRNDYKVLYHLSLENARQRKFDEALYYIKRLIKVEGGSSNKSWAHLARLLSAKKCYLDALEVINATLEQTDFREQGELLKVKARCYMAQGDTKNAVVTYSQLLVVIERIKSSVDIRSFRAKHLMNEANLESEAWYDLAIIYSSMSQWTDAKFCISKLKYISPISSSRWHAAGTMYEAKGQYEKALAAYRNGLEVDCNHVPCLISTSMMLRRLFNSGSMCITRGILGDALKIDRNNHAAWFNLGLIHLYDIKSTVEAVDSIQASILLEDSAPADPFR